MTAAVPSTTQPAPGDPAGPDVAGSPLLSVIVLCFGGLTASLTQTMVIPIQGDLAVLLDTTEANASWVVTATLVAGAVAMPIAGRLGDLFGKQRVLAISAGLLVVGSLVCALSSTLLPMLAGRLLQGLAMGFIPLGIALIREITPPHLAGTAMAAMSATLGVGGAVGLPLAAWIAQDYSWHAMFWTATALAAVMTAAVLLVVPRVRDAVGGRFDLPGSVGLATGLVAVLVAVSKGNEWGWGEARTLGLLVLGVVALLVWAGYELRVRDPLCDLRVTARRPVLLTNLAAIAIGFGMMAQSIVVPRLLLSPEATGYGLGQTLLQTGLWMAPSGVVMMAFSPLSGRMIRVLGPRTTLVIGGTVLGFGYLFAFFLTEAPWQLMVATCIAAAGVGIGYAAMPTLILESVPLTEAGSAVGINALMRAIGASVSSAGMAAVLTASTFDLGGQAIPDETAFRICFGVGAAAAFVGALVARMVPSTPRSTAGQVR